MAEQQLTKKKKKKWFPIFATKEFNNMEIGETFLTEAEEGLNKIVEVNLGSLANDMKKQSINLLFKTTNAKDEKLFTEIEGYEASGSHIKKVTRTAKSKIIDSFVVQTKDNVLLRIKPIISIKFKLKRSILTALQKKSREIIVVRAQNETFNELLSSIANNNLQKDVSKEIRKIYPVSMVVIKSLGKEKAGKKHEKIEIKTEEKTEETAPESEEETLEETEETSEVTE